MSVNEGVCVCFAKDDPFFKALPILLVKVIGKDNCISYHFTDY